MAYFIFNSFAFDSYSSIPHDDLIAKNEFEKAREAYKNFCAKFPLSIYWFLAMERIDSIDSAQERFDRAEDLRKRFETEETAANQKSAENLYSDAMDDLAQHNMEDALRLLKQSAELATDPDAPELWIPLVCRQDGKVVPVSEQLSVRFGNEVTFLLDATRIEAARNALLMRGWQPLEEDESE